MVKINFPTFSNEYRHSTSLAPSPAAYLTAGDARDRQIYFISPLDSFPQALPGCRRRRTCTWRRYEHCWHSGTYLYLYFPFLLVDTTRDWLSLILPICLVGKRCQQKWISIFGHPLSCPVIPQLRFRTHRLGSLGFLNIPTVIKKSRVSNL